jgi:hypothetical protein
MNDFAEILKYILPSLIVGASSILTIKYFFDNEQRRRDADLRDQNRATVTPIRLQAYERIILFLERISPANLILRANPTEMDARQLQRVLVQQIRDEYEHNLSLQIYLSLKAWEMVKSGKEELILVINQSASELHPEAPGIDLAQKIFENYLKLERPPLASASEFIRQESARFF